MALTKISGSILKDPLNLGEVSIGGTLTYQDVTNVDSVGIGTFRSGINVSGGQLDVGNNIKIGNAGIITATELDISGDLDVDGHTNLDNTSIVGIVTISAGTNNEGLRITGQHNNCVIFTSPSINGSAGYRLNHHPSTNFLRVDTTDQNGTFTGTVAKFSSAGLDMADNIKLRLGSYQDLTLYHYGNDAYIDNADGDIIFRQITSEKLRIDSNGDIYTGGVGVRDDARLTIEKNKVGVSTAIHLHNPNGSGTASKISSSKALILSADVEDNTNADRSFISFETDNTERLRIKSDGTLVMNQTNNFIHTNSDAAKVAIFAGSTYSVSNGGVITVTGVNHSAGCFTDVAAGTGGHIQFRVGTSEKMRINSDGIMTRPQQPAFSAQGNSSPVDSNEGYTGILSNYMTVMECNVGSHYKTSGSDIGNFVAPVAGNYFFSAGCLIRLRNSSSAGSAELTFHKNGSNISNRSLGYSYVVGTNDHDNITITAIIPLAAGDKVALVAKACSSVVDWYWGEGLGNFSGYLIG